MPSPRHNYFNIGEFSKLSRCSIVSLRYYEKIGALIPAYVDEKTRYRYYTLQQLHQARLIRICIDAGVSPKLLSEYLNKRDSLDFNEIMDIFSSKADEMLRRAYANKILIASHKEEYRRSLKVASEEPSWATSLPLTILMLKTKLHDNAFDYQEYLHSVSAIVNISRDLGLTTLSQQGLRRGKDGKWYAYLSVQPEPNLEERVVENGKMIVYEVPTVPRLSQAIHGKTMEECFETACSTFPAEEITWFTELWTYTMVTGVNALEVTLRDTALE
ncbi:MAG: MerR family transcriptional regulator [Eggerthellaceae bacterium]|nr:MerR family transcriptional regulator [Eggerthellaceae bacterium]